jgi:hypothetical protein
METRSVESILAEWRAAERELEQAPRERWLAIMARIDQLQSEHRQAMADRTQLADELGLPV